MFYILILIFVFIVYILILIFVYIVSFMYFLDQKKKKGKDGVYQSLIKEDDEYYLQTKVYINDILYDKFKTKINVDNKNATQLKENLYRSGIARHKRLKELMK